MVNTYHKNHQGFILSTISDILSDGVVASAGVGKGIETYPLWDYTMQSIFLKMTGSQEQKIKCICWELATVDYEYRYDRFTKQRLGECSSYREKNIVYQDMVRQIKKHGDISFALSEDDRKALLSEVNDDIENIFRGSNLLSWAQQQYYEYHDLWKDVTHTYFACNGNQLFTGKGENVYSLKEMYDSHLYKQRNRIAHNTLSYQQNLPTLRTLVDNHHRYNNYFIYFSILLLVDRIFRHLYTQYLLVLEEL